VRGGRKYREEIKIQIGSRGRRDKKKRKRGTEGQI